MYISEILKTILMPSPLPNDDLELMSDFLLSLETRTDMSVHILDHVEVKKDISYIGRCEIADDSKFHFKARATAVAKHWQDFEMQRYQLNLDPEESFKDQPIPPPLKELPEDKPAGWTLALSEEQKSAAQKEYDAFICSKRDKLKSWRIKPPTPMAWSPRDGNAYKTTTRAQVENGDLYSNPNFRPIYMSYGLQRIGGFWEDPDATPEEQEELRVSRSILSERTKRSLAMSRERKIFLGHKVHPLFG
jgi:hypothetical protein